MKILIDARNISTTTGRYASNLVTHLAKLDKKFEYEVVVKPGEVGGVQFSNSKFRKISFNANEYTLKEQISFAKFLYSRKPDLVHFTLPQHPVLYFRPFIVTIHDLTMLRHVNERKVNLLSKIIKYRIKPKIFKFVVWHGIRFSKFILVPSHATKKDILSTFKLAKGKIIVTHESADKLGSKSKSITGLSNKDFLLYVGNAFPYKNLENLGLAYKKLQKTRPNLHLVIAGKKDYFHKELMEKLNVLGLKNIEFTGYVSDNELAWLYQNAKLYVFPSLSEGFGLPGLEAMRYGTPVVASNSTCLPEIYGNAAIYFDPTNVDSIANTIEKVLLSESLRKKLSSLGLRQAKKYSWAKMAEQTLKIYQKVLNSDN